MRLSPFTIQVVEHFSGVHFPNAKAHDLLPISLRRGEDGRDDGSNRSEPAWATPAPLMEVSC